MASNHTRLPPQHQHLDQVGWAQRLPRAPDAGRELTVLLRRKYTHGWVVLSQLREEHDRLQEFSMPQLEFAARHSRYRGDFRFYVTMREGETLIALSEHLRQSRKERAFEGTNSTPGVQNQPASSNTTICCQDGTATFTDTLTSDTERATAESSGSTGYGRSTTSNMAVDTVPPHAVVDPPHTSPWRETNVSDEQPPSWWSSSQWDDNQGNP